MAVRALPRVVPSLTVHWTYPTLTVALAVIASTRLPESLLRAQFWADDGRLYSQALGGESILNPYAGSLNVVVRAVGTAETLIPPAFAPLLGNAVALLVLAGVAAYAASGRMPWDRGALIALGIVALPASGFMFATLSHVQWPLAAGIALTALAIPPLSRRGKWAESAFLMIAGLTGPGSLVLAPLFVRGPRYRLVVVGTAATIQLAMLLTVPRAHSPAGISWELVPTVLLTRSFLVPTFGPQAPMSILLGAGVAACVGLLMRSRYGAWAAWLLLAVPLAALLATEFPTDTFLNPSNHPRYFWLAGVAIVVLVVTQLPRWPALAMTALLIVGATLSWRLPAGQDTDWASRSACIGGPTPCTVPVAPLDWDGRWDVRWEP